MTAALLENLFNERKIYRTGDLLDRGVNSKTILTAIDRGKLVRPVLIEAEGPVPGTLAWADSQYDPDFDDCVIMATTNGIICLQSAAMRHHISTSIRNAVDIYVPHSTKRFVPALNVIPHRTRRQEMLEVGVETRETDLGVPVRITSPARTIVDLIRNRSNSEDDYRHGLYALNTFVESGGRLTEITETAAMFGSRVSELVEIAANTAAEGYARGYGA